MFRFILIYLLADLTANAKNEEGSEVGLQGDGGRGEAQLLKGIGSRGPWNDERAEQDVFGRRSMASRR